MARARRIRVVRSLASRVRHVLGLFTMLPASTVVVVVVCVLCARAAVPVRAQCNCLSELVAVAVVRSCDLF